MGGHISSYVSLHEERVQIIIATGKHIVAVEVEEEHAIDPCAGPAHYMGLYRGIRHVFGL
ncbi:MAG: hypothetical protein BWY79_00672 [Actinobacteria bacterium ADurb.Bin444]|nr:MAG: hypothetical protein BWY79_00672 [Actinobacteria bacterium ADurb.Bin444]